MFLNEQVVIIHEIPITLIALIKLYLNSVFQCVELSFEDCNAGSFLAFRSLGPIEKNPLVPIKLLT